MKKLFETNDYIHASLVESKLIDEDIFYIKTGDEQHVLRGTLPPNDTLITILVDEEDYDLASRLVDLEKEY
ncbi:putative signal transducing protein [Leptospira wolffii]|uniref:Signal transducing protein n=1 Tax=Leptospira wolffii TaxID=409998 RepID=A0ABV5BK31_9LEPT|nr:DUF2007 domain-containing protein [Leptospira wolffii]TGL49164.1 hypothetical protein EHQ61_11895 [Leptospira wolffii]